LIDAVVYHLYTLFLGPTQSTVMLIIGHIPERFQHLLTNYVLSNRYQRRAMRHVQHPGADQKHGRDGGRRRHGVRGPGEKPVPMQRQKRARRRWRLCDDGGGRRDHVPPRRRRCLPGELRRAHPEHGRRELPLRLGPLLPDDS